MRLVGRCVYVVICDGFCFVGLRCVIRRERKKVLFCCLCFSFCMRARRVGARRPGLRDPIKGRSFQQTPSALGPNSQQNHNPFAKSNRIQSSSSVFRIYFFLPNQKKDVQAIHQINRRPIQRHPFVHPGSCPGCACRHSAGPVAMGRRSPTTQLRRPVRVRHHPRQHVRQTPSLRVPGEGAEALRGWNEVP